VRAGLLIVVGVVSFLLLIQTFAGTRPNASSKAAAVFPTPTPVATATKINCVVPNQKRDLSPPSDELTPENLRSMAENTDSDCDGIGNLYDNCAYTYNPQQQDRNRNGIGDACEPKKPVRKRTRPKPASE